MKKLSTPQGSHVPVSLTDVTEERGEEVEAPLQDAEWDHNKVVKTEVQQNSNCYNFQNQWVEEDQTPTSTKQAPRKQQVLRYLNIKFYATPILSSTLPQYQVLRYPNIKIQNVWARHQACQRDDLNLRGLETIVHKHYIILHYTISPINVTYIKFYATSTKTQNAGGEEEDASESRHGGENEDENNKDKSFKKADSTSQPKNITTISHGNCVSSDAKMSKTNTKKK